MLIFIRALFVTVIVSMLAVTGWASTQCALFDIPREVFTHPWFIATLFDAYWAFITFYVWVAWKEQTTAARVLWFIDNTCALGSLAKGKSSSSDGKVIRRFDSRVAPESADLQKAIEQLLR